jgi:hypothetical protein
MVLSIRLPRHGAHQTKLGKIESQPKRFREEENLVTLPESDATIFSSSVVQPLAQSL